MYVVKSTIVNSAHPGANDTAPVRVRKIANYTGGTSGYVNATLQVDTEASAGGTSYEWALLSVLNSYRTLANGSEDCASYFQAIKHSTGKTFGQVVELIDKLGDPTGSSVTQELDMRASGLDSNNNRVISHLVSTSDTGIISSVGEGIRISADGLAPISRCIRLYGSYAVALEGDKFNIDKNGTYTTARSSSSSSSEGSINFMVDGTTNVALQALGASQFGVYLGGDLRFVMGTGEFRPHANAAINCGAPSYRWNTVYASTGSINTSDERVKTFLSIEDAEVAAAKAIRQVVRKFQFNTAIDEKGADKARYHFGVGAQTVRDILIAHGLEPDMYGFLCHDTWDDTYEDVFETQVVNTPTECKVRQDDGTYKLLTVDVPVETEVCIGKRLVRQAGELYGIRYDELLMFLLLAA